MCSSYFGRNDAIMLFIYIRYGFGIVFEIKHNYNIALHTNIEKAFGHFAYGLLHTYFIKIDIALYARQCFVVADDNCSGKL